MIYGRRGSLIDSQQQRRNTIAAEYRKIAMGIGTAVCIGLCIPKIRVAGSMTRACRGTQMNDEIKIGSAIASIDIRERQ